MVEVERPSSTIPAELTRRAQAIADGATDWQIPEPRDAATVILLRESADAGVEVFLQRRVGRMAFAAGMHVFPGGKVELSDADPAISWNGDPEWEPFEQPPDPAVTASFRALTIAAARETWEEAGVALASDDSGPVSGHPADAGDPFLEWVTAGGLTVSGDRFAPWAHWITPEVESRRFDTRFVVAALPSGQEAVDRGMESEESSWITAATAIDRLRAGTLPMLPPTAQSLMQLAAFESVAAIMADARMRHPVPILPRPTTDDAGQVVWRVVNPYTGEVIRAL